MNIFLICAVSVAYLAFLYLVAQLVERRPNLRGVSPFQGWIYALSIGVYCTSWTFYGSVGRCTQDGIGFLPIYVGPILIFVVGHNILRKILRITKTQNTTSIADFISSRYGKSQVMAAMVTLFCLVGVVPYIALQLESVSNTFNLLIRYPNIGGPNVSHGNILTDTSFYVALLIGFFVTVFGTRRVDVTEKHHGIVIAIALESIVKLVAFLSVGFFVVFELFGGFGDLFAKAAGDAKLHSLLDFGSSLQKPDFWSLTFLSGLAIFCLPRQFQVMFVENTSELDLGTARRVFPCYLVLINLFVLPIAFAGILLLGDKNVNPDTFVLTLPIFGQNVMIAILAFIGGLSAASGMIAVETVALSTMICNDVVMPIFVNVKVIDSKFGANLGLLVKTIRRLSIILIVLAGWAFSKLMGGSYALVSMGLLSFVASAQFAPALIGGIYWRRATKSGAIAGLALGAIVWTYTLLLPALAKSGWLSSGFVEHGILGICWSRPYHLFGYGNLNPITHGLFWSLAFNLGAYVIVSLLSRQNEREAKQSRAFVDVFNTDAQLKENECEERPNHLSTVPETAEEMVAGVCLADLIDLLARFIGEREARTAFEKFANSTNTGLHLEGPATQFALQFIEKQLTGVVGAANAQRMSSSIGQFGKNSIWLDPVNSRLLPST